jgi:uncharacterized membrane protein
MKWVLGILWALVPITLLSFFYIRGSIYADARDNYHAGLLVLLLALVSCFVCPIPLAFWCFGWRERSSVICFLVSLFLSALCLAILYYDPGHKIYTFIAD